MAWQDRLREGAFRNAVGDRFTFQFTDVSKRTPYKGSIFQFPDVDGAYVQRRGLGGRSFPMRVFFSGDNNDLEADAFERGLEVQGVGVLEHPRYGEANVTPLGSVERSDGLVNGANQVSLQFEFFETIVSLYPQATEDGAQNVINSVDAFNAAAAAELESKIVIETASERFDFLEIYKAALGQVDEALAPVADLRDDLAQRFYTIRDSIDASIDTLIDDPLTLAFQTLQLIQAPAQAVDDIQAQLVAYRNLALSIFTGDGAVRQPGNNNESKNNFQTASLFATGVVTASCLASVNGVFETKPGSLSAASNILELFSGVSDWRDLNHDSLLIFDTGGLYDPFLAVVSGTVGHLVTQSFGLRQERRFKLTENRTPLDLVAELYGRIDNETQLFFANSNFLSGIERLEIKKGREIVHYV